METSRSTQRDRVFRFGPFELSEHDAELRKGDVRIKLQDQPFRVLVELVANAGKVVSREELQQKLWSADTFVDFDVGLNNAIRKLRQALNDDADHPHYIETLAKRGYRFVAQVAELGGVPQSKTEAAQVGPAGLDRSQDRIAAESRDGTVFAKTLRERAMPWLLMAAVFAIAALGSYQWWRGKHSASPLATEQQVTANPPEAPITAAVVSPDGKYVAYSDTTGVYVRHIDTGETRPLQLPAGFNAVPTSWFPDGTHLLLSSGETLYWFGRLSPGVIPSLWKVSLLGGSPQKLVDNASGGAVSPDGSKIAYTRGDAQVSREIWVMSSDGNNPQKVLEASRPADQAKVGDGATNRSYSGAFFSSVAWSPDGSHLAYLRRFAAASSGSLQDKYFLETVGVTGGAPKVLKVSIQLIPVVWWAADGRLVYGYRDNPDTERMDYGVWWIRVSQRSGESEGKEVQLTKGTGRLGGLSVTADGKRMIVWRDNLSPAVFLMDMDPKTRRLTRPRRLTLDENPSMVTDWTPDSRAVLFVSNRNGGTYKLFRQGVDQAVPEVLVDGRGIVLPRVSPDGTQVLYLAGYKPENPGQPISLMTVPLAGGPPREILQMSNVAAILCTRSPSKICLLATTERLFAFDPRDGKLEPFSAADGPPFTNWSLSPDGSLLALVYRGSRHKITFVTVGDNMKREVELKETLLLGMDWAAGSKTLYVTATATNGSPVVLGVEPNGNQRVLLEGDKAIQYWWVMPSPDGRYWALEAVIGANNIWMVENF